MGAPPQRPNGGLEKRAIPLPFAQGIDSKTDPLQLKPGSMAQLTNCVFTKAGRVDKRNGFGSVSNIGISPSGQQIATWNNGENLVVYGPNQVTAYDEQANSWVNEGTYNPISVQSTPVVRNNQDIRNGDIAFDPTTHRYCAVVTPWLKQSLYEVFDNNGVSLTGQVQIPGYYARVFLLGTYFVVTYHGSGPGLYAIAIPITNPSLPSSPTELVAGTYTATPKSGALTISGVNVNTFEYGFSSNQYTVALLNNGTHGFETSYFQGDNNGDGTHVDLSISMVSGTSTINDIQASINEVPNAPSAPQGGPAVNCFYTQTSGTATCLSHAAIAMSGGSNPNHDGCIASDGNLYLLATLSNGTLQLIKMTTSLTFSSVNIASANASLVSICDDPTTQYLFVSWVTVDSLSIKAQVYHYNLSAHLGTTTMVTQGLSTVGLVAGFPIISLTSIATGGSARYFYQVRDWYAASQYGITPPLYYLTATQRSDKLYQLTMTTEGAITKTAAIFLRGVGLASKPVYFQGTGYLVVNYQSPLEPTNFLVDFNGAVHAKMGPSKSLNTSENSFSWYLPQITVGTAAPNYTNAAFLVPHLVIDQLVDVQKVPGAPFPSGIFTFAGLNYDTLQLNLSTASSAEIADVLHLAGGFPWMYDGTAVVEHGFHLYPDVILLTANGGTPGNAFTQYWYATYEWMDSTGKLHRSAPSFPIQATIKNSGGNFTFNIATLRLTAKDNVQICLYRWSQSQPTPYFVSSIANDPTVDYVSITDPSGSTGNDAAIAGQRTLYTWGGELENVSAPACIAMSMFRARLFVVSSEDQNTLYFTKQCIEGVPAEFADGFQMFIAPTISSIGPTGFVEALYPLDDKLIIFKTNAIYYIVGNGPDNTGQFDDFSDPIFITSSVGCANQNSAIMIPDGIMFQSSKGIWLLGRDLSTNYIGAPIEDFVINRTVTSAVSIPGENHIRFTLDNGNILVYDYFFKQWSVFVLANNALTQDSCIYNNLHTILDSNGNIIQETPGVYLDGNTPVAMSLKTGWYNLAGIQGFFRAYWFNLLGTYQSPHTLNLSIDYDYNTNNTQTVSPIVANSNVPEQYRIFLNQQKCQAFRLTLTEVPNGAGAGLTLSGINILTGGKYGQYPRLNVTQSTS